MNSPLSDCGGKSRLAENIISRIPKHVCYVELFCGAAWVFFKKPGDTYVYALIADELLDKDVYTKDPFASARTRVFQPRLSNQRIIAQDGWFTLHRFSKSAHAFVPIDVNPDTKKHLAEIRIPSYRRDRILKSLDRHGITRRTLFPDLEGLCSYLNWKYKVE